MKAGFSFYVTPEWKIGGDMVAASSQTISGNENGALPQVPGYVVFNAQTSYQVSKQLEIYGLIQNVLDYKYYTYGSLFETGGLLDVAPYLTDPRTLGNAMPFAVYAGLKYRM